MQNIRLDAGAAALLARLHGAGYAAYAVGGCVRDSLLGRTPQDWDLCTSARPEQVLALFGEGQCIPTGLQHGTVTIKYGGQLYETTTFRTEGAYTDGRHPDEVHFVPDVRQDLARRDFTINAMAYNDAEGLIDPFGVSCGPWATPPPALKRMPCASCGCTGSRRGSALPSTRPPGRRPGHCVPIWTACRWSGSKKSCLNCWKHPPRRHILMKKY